MIRDEISSVRRIRGFVEMRLCCISEFRKASKIIREFRQNATHNINLSCDAIKYQNPTLVAMNNKTREKFASLIMDVSLIFAKIVRFWFSVAFYNNPVNKLIKFVDRLIYRRANFSRSFWIGVKNVKLVLNKNTTCGLNSRFMPLLLLFGFVRSNVGAKNGLSWKVKSHRV